MGYENGKFFINNCGEKYEILCEDIFYVQCQQITNRYGVRFHYGDLIISYKQGSELTIKYINNVVETAKEMTMIKDKQVKDIDTNKENQR